MKNLFIKGITITLFFVLIAAFVAYKSGFISKPKSIIAFKPLSHLSDTIPAMDSLKSIQMMPSSKAIIIRDRSTQVGDSSKIKIDTTAKFNHLIYSSKSGIILKPEDLKKLKMDSTVYDSLKK